MEDIYHGPERRRTHYEDALIRQAVKEAVAEALRAGNLIDGPTHIAHHQALAEFLEMMKHFKKSVLGVIAGGFIALVALGFMAWMWSGRSS